jgi:hypothetical protein
LSRNIEIRAYLNADELNNIKDAAAQRKMTFNTDSELVRKVFFDYSNKIQAIGDAKYCADLKNEALRQQMISLEAIVEQQKKVIHDKQCEIDVLKNNLEIAIKNKGVKHAKARSTD